MHRTTPPSTSTAPALTNYTQFKLKYTTVKFPFYLIFMLENFLANSSDKC